MVNKESGPSMIGKIFYVFVIIFLIVVISVLSYYIYLNLPRNPQQLNVDSSAEFQPVLTSPVDQFYPNMKFNHKIITYFIDRNCDEIKTDRIENAFDELSKNVPVITFIDSISNLNKLL